MPKPQKHIFVCAQGRPPGHPRGSCSERGCQPMVEEWWYQMTERDLFGRFALTQTACIGPCGVGPNVLIYPEGVMYSGVSKEDVSTIIEQHLLADEVVTALLAPDDMWG